MKPDKDSEWYMGGTDGSGEYIVIAQGVHGRVGYRTLGDKGVRVRVEPNTMDIPTLQSIHKRLGTGWNAPVLPKHNRFSRMIPPHETTVLKNTLSRALFGVGGKVLVNPDGPDWTADLVTDGFIESNMVAVPVKYDEEEEKKAGGPPPFAEIFGKFKMKFSDEEEHSEPEYEEEEPDYDDHSDEEEEEDMSEIAPPQPAKEQLTQQLMDTAKALTESLLKLRK